MRLHFIYLEAEFLRFNWGLRGKLSNRAFITPNLQFE